MIMKNFKFSSLLLAPLFAVLAACGGGGGDKTTTPTTPAVPTLKSIAIAVSTSTTIPVSVVADATAVGTYSDGTSKPLTVAGGLQWATKSGNATVASIATATGKITAVGVGTETITATQDSVVGSLTITVTAPWTQVSAGGFQTIARRADGKLYAWGQNNWGQLGDNSNLGRETPVAVNNGSATTAWRQVSVGEQFAVGIRAATGTTTTGGTLWAWGLNTNGQLGQGNTTNRSVPMQIGKDATWVSVSAGKYHALALKADGTLWAWGLNTNGQLGDTTTIGRQEPVQVGGSAKTNTAVWIAFSAGGTHSMGIQKDGSLWTWGSNVDGQLGNSSTSSNPVSTPTKIGTGVYNAVSAGASHSMAIATNGTLWGWGANGSSQLGNNATGGTVTVPRQFSPDNDWNIVSAGGLHTLAIRKDGSLWAWGSNADGQLGDGSGADDAISPKQIGTERTWVAVSAGDGHSAALKADNSLWTWGRNGNGQLGNGKTVTSPVPVNIPNPTPN
jgi:alpha-tubulin suppressor-like RCC1 family protein